MTLQTLTFNLMGISPLLMHNGQLANPMNEHTKRLKAATGKRKKTDDDLALISDIEWRGGLYVDEKNRVCLPGYTIEAALLASAKKSRMGPQTKAGLFVDGNFRLVYSGPKDVEKLQDDPRFRLTVPARVTTSRIMRTRPIFRDWAVEVTVTFNPELLNPADIVQFMDTCGEQVGLGDWRPKHGRFVAELVEAPEVVAV